MAWHTAASEEARGGKMGSQRASVRQKTLPFAVPRSDILGRRLRCSRDLTASELPCHKILRPRGSRDAQSREVCKAKCIRERAVEC